MSGVDLIQVFLADVGRAYSNRNQDPNQLARALQLDNDAHNRLRSALQQAIGQDLGQKVTSGTRIQPSERIHSLLVSFLEYVSNHDSTDILTQGKGLAQSALPASNHVAACSKWSEVYSRASLVFQAQEKPFFGPTLRYLGISLVLLAISTDNLSGDLAQPCITDAVSKISRTTGIAAIDRSPLPGEQTKRCEVLWLANASFRCYFKLKNIRLCETVLGSVENALKLNQSFASVQQKAATASSSQADQATSLGMACYSRADKVAYRYYLGRLRLSQHRIRAAYNELRFAFDNCTNTNLHNKNLILSHLVVASIILGIYPSQALLSASNLEGPFGQLIKCIQRGDGKGMYTELEKWRPWHRKRGHYLLLCEKLEIGAWRNLMRRSFLIARLVSGLGAPIPSTQSNPPQPGVPPAATVTKTPPPVLKLASFLTLARRAWQDDALALDDVECVVASLIDQGYVKAYAMHSSGNVVFRRTADFGFVRMSTVY